MDAELVPGAGDASGLDAIPSRLPDAFGEAFGDFLCSKYDESFGELRADDGAADDERRGERRSAFVEDVAAEWPARGCRLRLSFSLSHSK